VCTIVGLTSSDSLVDILASLAAETSRDMTADDNDSLMSQVMLPLSAEEKREIVEESLEMSQRVWDDDVPPETDDDDDDDGDMYVLP